MYSLLNKNNIQKIIIKMKYKYRLSFLLIWLPVILSIRIPPNPCPDMFQYYKDDEGVIYGVAHLPYDNATSLVFSVNASFVGNPKQTTLRLERLTKVHELNDGTTEVTYNIYFPSNEVIPKITGITYNDIIYCSSYEPVGATRITNVRYQHESNYTRQIKGFYKPEIESDISEDNIPVKNPIEKPTATRGVPKPTPDKVRTVTPLIPSPQLIPNESPTVLDPTETDPGPDLIYEKLIDQPFPIPSTSLSPPKTFIIPSSNSDFKCGVAIRNEQPKKEALPFILIGTDTEIGQYPWLVAFFRNRGSKYEYKCSATLISDQHVLTAARCVQHYKIQVVQTEEIFLVMGTNNLDNWNSNGAVTRKAKRVDVHPSFIENSESAHGDIAIILMDRPVQFSNVLTPVCLWKGNTDLYSLINKTGVISDFSHALKSKQPEITIIGQVECQETTLGFQDLPSEKTFCTKRRGETPLTGPCSGDIGAGFIISRDGAYYLRGIASAIPDDKHGICDVSNTYSVFCDVAKFSYWIKSHMT
ncbi:serine protease gd-like isoform X1 [Diabrotica virgifera virgifera]|uniref:Peptidase S1 domain-containing protein n=2 Tax=Diabrotica virgifera virgifera TaxID=50390 RepID=A0ABM5IQB0_DIAVI|nr:serine protease gd-like isoform X1 [Diabrotica virgifera virgifera]